MAEPPASFTPSDPGPGGAAIVRRKISAPTGDGAVLVEPPLDALGQTIANNIERRRAFDYDVQGRTLTELSALARQELVREARRYTSSYRDVNVAGDGEKLFLAGHQPQLFHPGVWIKNFALGAVARAAGATPINLVVDSDSVKSSSLLVPTGSPAAPRAEQVAFDRRLPPIAFEERSIHDREVFESFGTRAVEHLREIVPHPLVETFWPMVVERAKPANGNLGACLAQARHRLEGQWGLQTLELPQSRVCQTEAFAWFAAHVLANLPRLWNIYNDALAEYRGVYKLRSDRHPVPDLGSCDGWLEAPFWLWTAENPVRRRLFAKLRDDELLISDRKGLEVVLPLSADDDAARAVEVLRSLDGRGIRLRTRALMTTMFARLVASDLFVHGIGGGKYDEITDCIAARFFGFAPPQYAILSGTLHLPLPREPASEVDLRQTLHRLRELEFHPERQLDGAMPPEAAAIVEQKRRWIATPSTHDNARERCRGIRAANAALQQFLGAQRAAQSSARDQLRTRLAAERVLARRDYGFCLYPERRLQDFMLAFRVPDF